jgi:transcriptional regulator with XRE-family HTH domain
MGLTNREIALALARRIRGYRVGMGISQRDLAERGGISLTSLSRFEQTGAITLNNLISVLRSLGVVDRVRELIPEHQSPSPLELLDASRQLRGNMSPTRARRKTQPRLS